MQMRPISQTDLIVIARAEFHVLVIGGHGVAGVAVVTGELDSVAVVFAVHEESVVLGPPVLTVNVPQVHA
jgi:hypothetical protein